MATRVLHVICVIPIKSVLFCAQKPRSRYRTILESDGDPVDLKYFSRSQQCADAQIHMSKRFDETADLFPRDVRAR